MLTHQELRKLHIAFLRLSLEKPKMRFLSAVTFEDIRNIYDCAMQRRNATEAKVWMQKKLYQLATKKFEVQERRRMKAHN